MAEYKVYRGEDKLIEVTLTTIGGTAIDLDTLAGIHSYIKEEGGNILNKYSLNAEAGFDTLVKSDAANGKYQIKLQSAKTINATIGVYSVESKIQRTDAGFTDNSKMDVGVITDFIEISDSVSKEDNDLTT